MAKRPCGYNKYHAKKVEHDGIVFDSKRERDHYLELKEQEKMGHIHSLELQPRFQFALPGVTPPKFLVTKSKRYPNGRRITYIADFRFVRNGRRVVQDVKGFDTDVSRMKRSLMDLFHGIEVEIVK